MSALCAAVMYPETAPVSSVCWLAALVFPEGKEAKMNEQIEGALKRIIDALSRQSAIELQDDIRLIIATLCAPVVAPDTVRSLPPTRDWCELKICSESKPKAFWCDDEMGCKHDRRQ
jgi:hypothetical protein